MYSEIITSTLAIFGSLLTLAISYWITKRSERETEWKKEKLQYYKAYIESLSGIIKDEDSAEGQRTHAKARNNMLLFASANVIRALNDYSEATKKCNIDSTSPDRIDELLRNLIIEMRKDIGFIKGDDLSSVKIGLWASGVKDNGN